MGLVMRRACTLLPVFVSLVFGSVSASTAAVNPSDHQPADVAAPKLTLGGKPHAGFMKRHAVFVAVAKKRKAQVVFLGDSIFARWGWPSNLEQFRDEFGQYSAANFGIGGDRTQHVLWRVVNGEFDGFTPKVVVLMIGTNNARTAANPPEQVAAGNRNIIAAIHTRSPEAKVLLHPIFPRGSVSASRRKKVVNALILSFRDGKRVHFFDVNDRFLDSGGKVLATLMPDRLHLRALGYQVRALAIRDKLAELTQ